MRRSAPPALDQSTGQGEGYDQRRAGSAPKSSPYDGLHSLPDVITRIDGLLDEVGLKNQEIVIRMTGCPNGCARPYMAEIAFVGKAPNKYQIYFGGNEASTRLNRLYKDSVKGDDIINELRPVFSRYVQERISGERFGDFSARVFWPETPAQPALLHK